MSLSILDHGHSQNGEMSLPLHCTWQDGPVHEGKVLLQPRMAKVVDVKVPLNKKHVLEQRSSGVAAVRHSFIERAIRHLSQQDQRLLHDGQNLFGPQVGLLEVPWRRKTRTRGWSRTWIKTWPSKAPQAIRAVFIITNHILQCSQFVTMTNDSLFQFVVSPW